MSGYYTEYGYVGLIGEEKILFATEADYEEYWNNLKENEVYV
ncbi:MAG: hypothetical protein Q4G33_07775 [bacterium]|nr:hypothetical protein [bacterium]